MFHFRVLNRNHGQSVEASGDMEQSKEGPTDEKLELATEEIVHVPRAGIRNGDAALEILGTTVHHVTLQEEKAVLRKVDLWVLPVVLMVYFLQQLDKSSLSYTSVFGIVEATRKSSCFHRN